jgi:hypothetical protein
MEQDRINDLKKAYFYANAMQASFIGYLVTSIFISTLYYPSFWIMTGFVVALRNITVGELANNFKTASGLSAPQLIKRPQTESRGSSTSV